MMKKRMIAIGLTIMMVAISVVCAYAQEGEIPFGDTPAPTANARVIAPEITHVTAPFGGVLLPFAWKAGDKISRGEALFELDTVKIYAAQSGRMGAVFAKSGDDAAGVMARYGSLCVIEALFPYYLDASTAKAHNHNSNKFLHVGETLYLKRNSDKGVGRVTSVAQGKYTVEILSGDFNLDNIVSCYRENGYAKDSGTGEGKVRRYDDVKVGASGRVFAVHKQEGDSVNAGDLLLEMIDSASTPDTNSCMVSASVQGAVTALHVAPGAQVYQGQLLCEIADLSQMVLSVEVDEIYLSKVTVGEKMGFVLDAFPEKEYQGTIVQIFPLGQNRQNAAYYDVRVSLPEDIAILPGMNATVYIR